MSQRGERHERDETRTHESWLCEIRGGITPPRTVRITDAERIMHPVWTAPTIKRFAVTIDTKHILTRRKIYEAQNVQIRSIKTLIPPFFAFSHSTPSIPSMYSRTHTLIFPARDGQNRITSPPLWGPECTSPPTHPGPCPSLRGQALRGCPVSEVQDQSCSEGAGPTHPRFRRGTWTG